MAKGWGDTFGLGPTYYPEDGGEWGESDPVIVTPRSPVYGWGGVFGTNPEISEDGVWGAADLDVNPPEVVAKDPAPEEKGVSADKTVSFAIIDDRLILLTTVEIHVNGLQIFNGDTGFVAGWTGSSYATNPFNGYNFSLVHDTEFEGKSIVTIRVVARDSSGLLVDDTWDFQTAHREFSKSVYNMIYRSVREQDERSPGLLQKLTQDPGGIDDIWRTRIYDRLSDLPLLLEPLNVDVEFLPWLKALLGFGRNVTLSPTEDQLRGILSDAMLFWGKKPTETALEFAVRMVTGNRYKIRNYFDFRTQLDHSILTEILEDFDPNLLDFPSVTPEGTELFWCNASTTYPCSHFFTITDLPTAYFPGALFIRENQFAYLQITEWPNDPSFEGFYKIDQLYPGTPNGVLDHTGPAGPNTADQGSWRFWGANSEFITELRLVDTLSAIVPRELLKQLINLVRPIGERIDIVFVAFLDQFITTGDLGLWVVDSLLVGGDKPTIPSPGGVMYLPPSSKAEVRDANGLNWQQRSAVFKVAGAGAGTVLDLRALFVDVNNYLTVEVDYTAKTAAIKKNLGGTLSTLGTVSLPDLLPNFKDTFRLDILDNGSSDYFLRLKYNGEVKLEVTDNSFTTGSLAIWSTGTADGLVHLVEVMTLPVSVERVGPNP